MSRSLLVVFLFSTFLFADLYNDIPVMAKEMAFKSIDGINSLSMSSTNRPIVITTIELDSKYDLSLKPVYDILQKELNKNLKRVNFAPFEGVGSSIARKMTYKSSDKKSSTDSLVLSGNYIIDENDLDVVWFTIILSTMSGTQLYTSEEIEVGIDDASPTFKAEIFKNINDVDIFENILYKQGVIKKFERLFNSKSGSKLLVNPKYRFNNSNPYAIKEQIEELKELLTLKYGVDFVESGKSTITVTQGKSMEFKKEGIIKSLSKMCDGTSPFPNEDKTVLKIVKKAIVTKNEKTVFKDEVITPQTYESLVAKRIYTFFEKEYANYFEPFNYTKLKKIFPNINQKNILVGNKTKSDPISGEEVVEYNWIKAHDWLASLNAKYKTGNRKFIVETKLLKLFRDPTNQSSYWAVVRQYWKTTTRKGKTVYKDDGFLLVNLIFDDDGNLSELKVKYRLWFYEYQYDHIIDGNIITSRAEKVKQDMKREFVNGISGVDNTLQNEMIEYVIGEVGNRSLRAGETFRIRR